MREVSALLDVMREDEAGVQAMSGVCQLLLLGATDDIQALDPELGDEELRKSLAVELAKLG